MSQRENATFGGGCFWCLEAVFEAVRGVEKVVSGYAAGFVEDPTYEQVCSGTTGHAEVVQVTFDPTVVTYVDLLEIFFSIHDPTTKDRQGDDVGTQYRSIVLHHDETQRDIARDVMARFEKEGIWGKPLVTEVEPLVEFFPAEDHHQGYFRNNPAQGYCRAVVAPKVAKFRAKHADKLKR